MKHTIELSKIDMVKIIVDHLVQQYGAKVDFGISVTLPATVGPDGKAAILKGNAVLTYPNDSSNSGGRDSDKL